MTAADLRRWCGERLVWSEVPRRVRVLPRTSSGTLVRDRGVLAAAR